MGEIWKPIPGFEEIYEVSSVGRVRSPRGFLKPQVINSGYCVVHLYPGEGEKRTVRLVHRLVAEAFVSGEGSDVNHKNLVKTDNRSSNLEWMTRKENIAHARERGVFSDNRQAVIAYPISHGVGFWFPSFVDAEESILGRRTGIVSWAVKHCKLAHGFRWEAV